MAVICSSTKHLAVLLMIVYTLSVFKQVEAKRGCSSFGHSCFGGHGKRSGGGTDPSQRGLVEGGQEEVAAPRPDYPRTIRDILSAGDDIIPIRNGGFADSSEDEVNFNQLKSQLSPYLKHWLMSYRKMQQMNGNGYPMYD